MATENIRIETVRKLELKEGDILFVQLGGDLGDGQGPWIPGPDDILETRLAWQEVLPPGIPVAVTHAYEHIEALNVAVLHAQIDARRKENRMAGFDEYL